MLGHRAGYLPCANGPCTDGAAGHQPPSGRAGPPPGQRVVQSRRTGPPAVVIRRRRPTVASRLLLGGSVGPRRGGRGGSGCREPAPENFPRESLTTLLEHIRPKKAVSDSGEHAIAAPSVPAAPRRPPRSQDGKSPVGSLRPLGRGAPPASRWRRLRRADAGAAAGGGTVGSVESRPPPATTTSDSTSDRQQRPPAATAGELRPCPSEGPHWPAGRHRTARAGRQRTAPTSGPRSAAGGSRRGCAGGGGWRR